MLPGWQLGGCGGLFGEWDLGGLDMWAPELADGAHQLLVGYHDVFSLGPAGLGCTHSARHAIKVADGAPFGEQFGQIPLLVVEGVGSHLREMLESGAIRPGQSAWCGTVVLVGGGMAACIFVSISAT